MARIIAGIFQTSVKAEGALHALLAEGVSRKSVSIYHNNAPGQHGTFSIGGDEYADPDARGAAHSAMTTALAGTAIGAGIGAAVGGPIGALAGAGVGAYTGALGGALQGLGEDPKDETTLPPPMARRPAGIMVAVKLDDTLPEDAVIALLRKHSPIAVEEARGEWLDGQWTDFDPVAVPHLVWQDEKAFSSRH
jgi:outer membrane lipoprotein SlyB